MQELLYLRPFLVSFSAVVVLLFLMRGLTFGRGKILGGFSFVRRLGGVAVILAFLVAVLSDSRLVVDRALLGMIVGTVAILFFGVWDDVRKLDWKLQGAFQLALGGVIFIFGMRIVSLPVPFVGQVFLDAFPLGGIFGFVALLLWVVFLMNVLNWADGIDGLLPSISLVAFFVIFLLSLVPEVHQPPIGILSMACIGSIAGLLLFNFPPARILAGTGGAFFAGFMLASLSVLSGTKIATALLVLSLPVLDALWVFFERVRSGASPFLGGDARHLHYRLREIGWSDRRIVAWYTVSAALIGALALSVDAIGKTVSFVLVCLSVFAFLSWVRRKTSLCRV